MMELKHAQAPMLLLKKLNLSWRYSFASFFLIIFVCTGCLQLAPDHRINEDSLFENWVKLQLMGIESWQASSAQGDPRNTDLNLCLWQRRVGENDCIATESMQYPLSLRMRNGYLFSSGIRFPQSGAMSWSLLERMVKGLSGGFGFDENWRPCYGDFCRFEVFTSFVPKCENNSDVCSRAERLSVSYVIVSRQMNRHIWQPYLRVLSNLDPKRSHEKIEFHPENIFGLPPLMCKNPSLIALTQDATGKVKCAISKNDLGLACVEPNKLGADLFGVGFCSPDNCKIRCEKALDSLSEECGTELLQPVPRSPDLFRCQGRDGLLYLRDPIDLHADVHQSGRAHLLFRVFGIEPDFCITREYCFGRFAKARQQKNIQPYLEIN